MKTGDCCGRRDRDVHEPAQSIYQRGRITGVTDISIPAPPNQTLLSVQHGVQSDYFIKSIFEGELSIEKCVAFCPRLPGDDKILLARTLHNIPPEMSIEESLGAIPFTLLFDPFCVYHSNC
jgi:hypothetical protein